MDQISKKPRSTRKQAVSKSAAGRTKQGTSRGIFAPKDRPGPFLVPSQKAGQLMVPCESHLEDLVAIACEYDARVLAYRSQPYVFDLKTLTLAADRDALAEKLGNETKNATLWFIDFELRLASNKIIFVEVKPKKRADKVWESHLEPRRLACERAGYGFALITEEDFIEPFETNLRRLWRYRKYPVTPILAKKILDFVALRSPITIASVEEGVGCTLSDMYALIARGELRAPVKTQNIGPETELLSTDDSTARVLPIQE